MIQVPPKPDPWNCRRTQVEAMSCFSSYIKDPAQVPMMFNLKFQTPLMLWEWSAQPGRIPAVMKGTGTYAQYSAEGVSLQENYIMVYVGGSAGSGACLTLKKAFPQLCYVVQDLEQPIASAKRSPTLLTHLREAAGSESKLKLVAFAVLAR
ncbi:hypothetical protein D9758_009168 [Tetrapyrgos nigripes]|uniref:Uncharacterized protein n=1 Tax=Tetrapyrgos nigripes TaxID=182062 RepID=A0A8H5LJY1_9AGAR|nr:hypothetical protein D9758_009168 [Tetrapyrgos nigripes]